MLLSCGTEKKKKKKTHFVLHGLLINITCCILLAGTCS